LLGSRRSSLAVGATILSHEARRTGGTPRGARVDTIRAEVVGSTDEPWCGLALDQVAAWVKVGASDVESLGMMGPPAEPGARTAEAWASNASDTAVPPWPSLPTFSAVPASTPANW
jgi:hypothetical protein